MERHNFFGATFVRDDTPALWGLLHLQVMIDRATRHIELAGNVSDIGLFAVEVVDLMVALHSLLVKGFALGFCLFGRGEQGVALVLKVGGFQDHELRP